MNKARFIQFSGIRIFVEDKNIASTAKNKNGKQYDFNSSTEIISEFEALDQGCSGAGTRRDGVPPLFSTEGTRPLTF